jgi:hypothetical protein
MNRKDAHRSQSYFIIAARSPIGVWGPDIQCVIGMDGNRNIFIPLFTFHPDTQPNFAPPIHDDPFSYIHVYASPALCSADKP